VSLNRHAQYDLMTQFALPIKMKPSRRYTIVTSSVLYS